LPEGFNGGDFQLRIKYTTGLKAAALNWLDEGDTNGGKMPYMYTMCQPINSRTIAPLQDTISQKLTYSADIQVPE
jgi:leukotriene-A4 hydrolase